MITFWYAWPESFTRSCGISVIETRQIKNFNQNNFLFDLGQRDWSRIRVVSYVDEKWNEWENKLMTVIDKHNPVKKKRVGRNVLLDYSRFIT